MYGKGHQAGGGLSCLSLLSKRTAGDPQGSVVMKTYSSRPNIHHLCMCVLSVCVCTCTGAHVSGGQNTALSTVPRVLPLFESPWPSAHEAGQAVCLLELRLQACATKSAFSMGSEDRAQVKASTSPMRSLLSPANTS